MFRGGAIDHMWEAEHLPGLIDGGYPGSMGGEAIVDVIMGEDDLGFPVGPTAKLPVTTYFANFTQQRDVRDFSMRASALIPGATHRFFDGPVLWPFGHGLTYSSFDYTRVDGYANTIEAFSIDDIIQGRLIINQTITVTNTGDFPSGVVVLALLQGISSDLKSVMPLRTLTDFARLDTIYPNTNGRAVTLFTRVDALAVTDTLGRRSVRPGIYAVHVGEFSKGAPKYVAWQYELTGLERAIEDLKLG